MSNNAYEENLLNTSEKPISEVNDASVKFENVAHHQRDGGSRVCSETTDADVHRIPFNNFTVKNSSDIQIGDRTYLTINQPVLSSTDDLSKIVCQALKTPKLKTVLNVKPLTEGESHNIGPIQELNIIKEGLVPTPLVPDDQTDGSPSKNNTVVCGRSINVYAFVVLLAACSLLTAGLSYVAVHFATLESTPGPSTSDSLDVGSTNVSDANGLEPPSYPHPNGWILVTRKDWGAWRPTEELRRLIHPIKIAVVAHTAGASCDTRAECSAKMRDLQDFSVGDRGFADVPYNFLVGHDGNAYEGLGWDVVGIHSAKYNRYTIAIAFMGNYVYQKPSAKQLQVTKNILAWGVEMGKLSPDYHLVAHNMTTRNLSPGRFVYQEIMKWPHFTANDSVLPI